MGPFKLRDIESMTVKDRGRIMWRALFRSFRHPLAWVVIAIAVYYVYAIITVVDAVQHGRFLLALLHVALSMCGIAVAWPIEKRVYWPYIERELRRLGRCGECGYDLRPPHAHGRELDEATVVCPECGTDQVLGDVANR